MVTLIHLINYKKHEWKICADLKVVAMLSAIAVETKESYDSMVTLLHLKNYKKHEWKICADLKVLAMQSHLQQGYTKYMCFLCK